MHNFYIIVSRPDFFEVLLNIYIWFLNKKNSYFIYLIINVNTLLKISNVDSANSKSLTSIAKIHMIIVSK